MNDQAFIEQALWTAAGLAREAGALLLAGFGGGHQVVYKGEIDIVTEADRASEDFLVERLRAAFPAHSIMTEEGGGHAGDSPFTWVMDPLDGTTNFAHGFPFFCVSIALARDGDPLCGAVYDPVRDELYTALKGGGSFLNGRRLTVSTVDDLGKSLLATGFPYDIRRSSETNLENFAAFAVRSQAIRRAGSAALDLCYVAAGRFDGYWELKLRPWDMAAGVLILGEAGGRVSDLQGGPWHLKVPGLVASNGLIHQTMLDVIRDAKKR